MVACVRSPQKKKPAADRGLWFFDLWIAGRDQFLMAMQEMSERFSVRQAASAES